MSDHYLDKLLDDVLDPVDKHAPWATNMGPCVICEEAVWDDDDPAEMHDANMLADPEMYSEAQGGIVHAQCGLDKGWIIS